MKNLLLGGILLFAIVGCSKKEENFTQKDAPIAEVLTVETFPLPENLRECACRFAENEQNFQAGKLIYADDYGNTAYLKIDGNEVQIPMKEGDFDPEDFSKILENEQYIVKISTKKLSENEMRYSGSMTITEKKTKKMATTPIFGECGCPEF